MTRTLGLALGGGGARGLAHLPFLETLDDMGVKVSAIAGTSIGAIVGSGYAAGHTARDLRNALDALLSAPKSFDELLKSDRVFGWLDLLSIELGKSHLLNAHAFLDEMRSLVGVEVIEDLNIPLQIVASDFWNRDQVVFDSGPLLPALSASFCLPGVFRPVVVDGRVLIDGGCVNPVPFDVLRTSCDVVIAIDVLGVNAPNEDPTPTFSDMLFNSFQIAQASIAQEKRRTFAPNLYLRPTISGVRVLDFHKSEEIYTLSSSECERLRRELPQLLDA